MSEDSFFMTMLNHRQLVDESTFVCYSQLCYKLGYCSAGAMKVTVDGKKVPLFDAVMSDSPDSTIPTGSDDTVIFRSAYIKAFEDGELLFRLVKDIKAAMGESTVELDTKLKSFAGKSHSKLRAVYWWVDEKFVSQLEEKFRVSFEVDCMMFSSFQCNNRNVIGMHLVILAVMMGMKKFKEFLPPDVARCPMVTVPPFKALLREASGVTGAGMAKSVDRPAAQVKGAKKDVTKGAK